VSVHFSMAALPKPGAVVVRGAARRPYSPYCTAVLWRSSTAGAEESDPKASGLLAQLWNLTPHRAGTKRPHPSHTRLRATGMLSRPDRGGHQSVGSLPHAAGR
jgi:hypothetical protein